MLQVVFWIQQAKQLSVGSKIWPTYKVITYLYVLNRRHRVHKDHVNILTYAGHTTCMQIREFFFKATYVLTIKAISDFWQLGILSSHLLRRPILQYVFFQTTSKSQSNYIVKPLQTILHMYRDTFKVTYFEPFRDPLPALFLRILWSKRSPNKVRNRSKRTFETSHVLQLAVI